MKCVICKTLVYPGVSCCDIYYEIESDFSVNVLPETLERGLQFCNLVINLEFTRVDWGSYNGWSFNFRLIEHHPEWQLACKLL